MREIAVRFGQLLDRDDFAETKKLLSPDCTYVIGADVLTGPDAICASYEKSMLEGRAKLDELVWGRAEFKAVNESEYLVHFTDFLTHKGVNHTFKCKQQVTVGDQGTITRIEHHEIPGERQRLDAFYKVVGLK